MLSNWDVSGESETIGTMGTIPIQFQQGRIFGLHAVLKAGKREALGGGSKSVGTSWEMTVRDIRPTVSIVASCEESFAR